MLTVPDVGWISSCLVHAATCEPGRFQQERPQAQQTQKPSAAASWCGTAAKTAQRAQTRTFNSIVATCFFSPHRHWIELDVAHPWLEPALRSTNQISGSERMDEKVVAKAAGLSFPQSLLILEPGQIKAQLMRELPVQEVSVQRHLFPPGLSLIHI